MSIRKQMHVLLFSAAIVLVAFCPIFGQAGIYLDHADGFDEFNCVEEGGMVTFHMRVVGDWSAHYMLNNGYEICSDEMTWDAVTVEFNPAYPIDDWFDFVKIANLWDWPHCDTVGIGLLSLFGTGLPAYFDGILYSITIGPVSGGSVPGATVLIDSSWFQPACTWMWDIVGIDVAWGGPYVFTCSYLPMLVTYCTPQPTILKSIEDILEVHIRGELVSEVIMESIRVQSKIPPYEGYPIVENGEIVTACFIMRFLGSSGFRPITGDFEATYTVEYDMVDGIHKVLVGDFALKVYPGDVTLDGHATIDDMIFAADYFWRTGDVPAMKDNTGQVWEVTELLDVNQDGDIDPRDVVALKNILGL